MECILDKGCHLVYCIQFHLVFCVKYRREVLSEDISDRLKENVLKTAPSFDVKEYVQNQGQ
jgi:putative transposase